MNINLKVAKSIFGSTVFKLSSAAISFITVPLLLKTLGTNDYAIWVTVTALLAWLNLFDFGSGFSLKNKVGEANANNDKGNLEVLVAGTLQFYLLMTALLTLAFIISIFFVSVFKAHLYLALIIYIPIIFSFPFTLGHFIMQGLRKFNLFNGILLSQNIIWLLILLGYKFKFFEVNIYKLAYCYSGLYVLANLAIICTSLKAMQFNGRQLLNFNNFLASKKSLLVGSKFFLLQVSSLFLYSIGNLLTYSNLTLKNVAQYDTVNKIFLLGITMFNVLITVFWTEISHAKALANKDKLTQLYNQLFLCAGAFSAGTIIISFFIPQLIGIWTNKTILIGSVKDIYPFTLLAIIQIFAYSGAVFLNALEKLNGQIVLSVIASLLMIPVTKLLFNLSVGIGSVPLSSAILTIPTLIFVVYKSRAYIRKV